MRLQRVKLHALFDFEVKRVLNYWTLGVLAILLLFMGYLVNTNVNRYRNVVKNTAELREVEARMFKNIRNYTHYSFHGLRVFTIPAVLIIFFDQQGGGLTAKVNSVASLDIYKDYKGKFMPGLYRGNSLSFGFLVLVLGTLFPLFMGYESVMYRGYLKFLCSACPGWKVLLTIISARLFILYIYIIICYSWMLVLVALRGVFLTAGDYACLSAHLVSALLMMGVFLLAGIIIGTYRLKKFAVAVIAAVWFTFVYIVPWAVNTVIENLTAKLPSSAQITLQKLDIVNQFENDSNKKYGNFDRKNITTARIVIEGYWKYVYKELNKIETELIGSLKNLDKTTNRISILTPTTFYNLTSVEVSSKGYRDYIRRLLYLIELQGRFVRFYIDRCFYNDPDVLVPFVKGNENLYRSLSYLPRQFTAGAAVQMLYILILATAAMSRFERLVYRSACLKKENAVTGKEVFKIRKGEFRVFFVKRASVVQRLFNHLSGRVKVEEKKGTGIPFEIENIDTGFTYICHPDEFPDAAVKDFQAFMVKFFRFPGTVKDELLRIIKEKGIKKKYFRQLKSIDKGDVMLWYLSRINSAIFMADDIARGLPADFYFHFNNIFKNAADAGASVLYLTGNILIADNRFEADDDVVEIKEWSKMVETIETVNEK